MNVVGKAGGQLVTYRYHDAFRSETTTEHFFQAAKFFEFDDAYAEEIRTVESPAEAKKMGAAKRLPREILDRWKAGQSTSIMDEGILAKFTANECHLGRRLLALTGDKTLVEHVTDDPSWDDRIWGCGKDGVGENRMGIRLQLLREKLRVEIDT